MDWVDKPQNYKDLYGVLQTLRGSHLNNSLRKTLKLGWVAFHSLTFQSKCLDFQSNQYKKLVPVPIRFCNWLCLLCLAAAQEITPPVHSLSRLGELYVKAGYVSTLLGG